MTLQCYLMHVHAVLFCAMAFHGVVNFPWFSQGGPCGLWVGVSPPQIRFLFSNPPQGATFVCWPPPNSQSIHPHLVGSTLRAPGLGEPPTNKILHGKPTPRSNFCLLAPTQFFTLQGFSDGVTIGGTPRGQHFWVAPLLGAEPG
jgi:hypothetical protein